MDPIYLEDAIKNLYRNKLRNSCSDEKIGIYDTFDHLSDIIKSYFRGRKIPEKITERMRDLYKQLHNFEERIDGFIDFILEQIKLDKIEQEEKKQELDRITLENFSANVTIATNKNEDSITIIINGINCTDKHKFVFKNIQPYQITYQYVDSDNDFTYTDNEWYASTK